jgi:hypothetical protein
MYACMKACFTFCYMPARTVKSRGGPSDHLPGMRVRSDGQRVVFWGAYVPPELAVRVRVHAARHGESLSSLVAEALAQHLLEETG